jgi:hypothetical protein
MDPITAVGAAAAVVQLAQLSAVVLSKGYGFLAQVTHAPTEIRRLLTESAAVNVMLGQLEALTETPSSGAMFKTLADTGIFAECRKTLETVIVTLDAYENCRRKGIGKLRHRLVWPMKEKEINDAMARLSKLRDIISTILQTDIMYGIPRSKSLKSLITL